MRTIDADSLYDFLTEQLDKETGAYSKGRNAGINIARSALHDKTITTTITPPPNDPLTMDELQEMGDEPTPVYFDNYGWVICHGVSNFRGHKRINLGDGIFTDTEGYGETWNAYRRKPEEV